LSKSKKINTFLSLYV
jgi:hypothetical protein